MDPAVYSRGGQAYVGVTTILLRLTFLLYLKHKGV